jgi:hypothetical protein
MPWRPSEAGEWPTLGWAALDWIESYLATPDRADYEPLRLTREQAEFVLKLYRLNPVSGARVIHRAVLSRPRGWGKSPMLAALAAWEALGEPVFDGWDAQGQPVGRPWATIFGLRWCRSARCRRIRRSTRGRRCWRCSARGRRWTSTPVSRFSTRS